MEWTSTLRSYFHIVEDVIYNAPYTIAIGKPIISYITTSELRLVALYIDWNAAHRLAIILIGTKSSG